MAGTLDGRCQATLMLRTGTRSAARQDLAPVGDIALEALNIFIIRQNDLVGAELAYLAPWCVAAAGRAT